MSLIAGADEAGRGCLIGPLVIGIAFAEEGTDEQIKKIGARDSKELSPTTRTRLYKELSSICRFKLVKITAQELNSLMKKHSLNEIEALKLAEGLKGEEIETLVVDSPDTDTKRFEKRIRNYTSSIPKIISEHKADSKYPIVSAASIAAKVERDEELEKIKREVGFDFGSGYTSDERTIDFVKKNLANKTLQKYLRTKWSTLENLKQRRLGEFGD
ncbi:MAG: ribonuclease HII [Candidatus Micrarchaeota archaeon]